MLEQSYLVNVAVRNLDDSIRRYERVLGVDAIPMPETSGTRGVYLTVGGLYALGLVSPDEEPRAGSSNPVSHHLATKGEGAYLLGLLVDDLEAHQVEAQARGIRFATPEPVETEVGKALCSVPEQTCGTVIQLAQMNDPAGEHQRWSDLVASTPGRRTKQAYVLDIAVGDLIAAERIYTDLIGTEPIPMPEGADPSNSMDAVHYTIGEPSESGVGGLYSVGLMTPRGAPMGPIPQAIHDCLRAHGDGSFLIAFLVNDLDEQIEHLRALGISLCYDEPMRYVHGRLQMTEPIHGVSLDFAQHDPDAFERWQEGE